MLSLNYSIYILHTDIDTYIRRFYIIITGTCGQYPMLPSFFFLSFFLKMFPHPPFLIFFNIDFISYKQHFATFYVSLYDIYTIFRRHFWKLELKLRKCDILATSADHLKYWRYGKTREFRVKLNFAPKNSRTFYPELSRFTVSSIFQMTSRCR